MKRNLSNKVKKAKVVVVAAGVAVVVAVIARDANRALNRMGRRHCRGWMPQPARAALRQYHRRCDKRAT